MKQRFLFSICFFSISVSLIYCSAPKKEVAETPLYKSWNDTVGYVGMSTCKNCHQQIYETFINTGMGESWDVASPQKSSGRFDAHNVVYDSYKDFYYKPFWKDSLLYIMEYRLSGKDTIYKRSEQISYIVGSGQHTNSHIWQVNGYLYQAPLTFYTQKGIWEMPPGFEDGMNTRWNRIISIECMNCHNMYPDFDTTSENKFTVVKKGIECERCHGAGEAHVNEKLKGILIDTSKYIDYSIVNPKKLSRDLQVELCQRCHLQGISVLNEGKTFFDFKPGQPLNTVMNVFMPRYEGGEGKFIMASHVDRMKQSKCYLQSQMTCLTCHNPHISVKVTLPSQFNATCKSCHGTENHGCKLPVNQRMTEKDNCFKCHMPVSETLDIPHVTVHDHRIQVPVTDRKRQEIQKFVGIECMTTKNPSPLLMAKGYLQTFEAFSAQPYLLDSANKYLESVKDKSDANFTAEQLRYFYLKKQFKKVVELSGKMDAGKINDSWTAYRIGEGNYQLGDFNRALDFYQQAVVLKSSDPEFNNKLGSVLVALKRLNEAKEVFEKIVQDQPKFAPALSNLGYVYFLNSDFEYSGTLYDRALALDPDYEQALMNKIALLIVLRKNDEAGQLAVRVLKINPDNEKAKMVLKGLGS
ncbi:MAG: tetratricopeptide repeat protein [Chitinophagaceae bacterium]|nr:tetratricopeptide repeat protein [Chitinophagaceae bacterium]